MGLRAETCTRGFENGASTKVMRRHPEWQPTRFTSNGIPLVPNLGPRWWVILRKIA